MSEREVTRDLSESSDFCQLPQHVAASPNKRHCLMLGSLLISELRVDSSKLRCLRKKATVTTNVHMTNLCSHRHVVAERI